jgi:hypothetical protein
MFIEHLFLVPFASLWITAGAAMAYVVKTDD